MKKIVSILSLLITSCILISFTVSASDKKTIFADSLNNGTYNIEVESSSSMFRIVKCELKVQDNKMTAVMTLSGKGYEKLYMGTGNEAINSPESDFIYYEEDNDGKYTYEVPVEGLDKEIDCTAYSFKKQKWYDRKIVFKSSSLPDNAIKNNKVIIFTITASIFLIIMVILTVVKLKGGNTSKKTE